MKDIGGKLKRFYKLLRVFITRISHENNLQKLYERTPQTKFFEGAFVDEKTTLGEKTVLHAQVTIVNSQIGRYTYFASGTSVANTKIGSFCSIGPDVRIGLGKHPSKTFVSTYPAFFSASNGGCLSSFVDKQLFEESEPVEIGNDVWIGARVLINDGVKVGDGAILAAGSIVTKDVESYSIVGGVPARHLKYRFSKDEIDALSQLKWWDKDLAWIKEHASKFDNISRLIKAVEQAAAQIA